MSGTATLPRRPYIDYGVELVKRQTKATLRYSDTQVWLYGYRSESVGAGLNCGCRLYACSFCDTQRCCSSSMQLVALGLITMPFLYFYVQLSNFVVCAC